MRLDAVILGTVLLAQWALADSVRVPNLAEPPAATEKTTGRAAAPAPVRGGPAPVKAASENVFDDGVFNSVGRGNTAPDQDVSERDLQYYKDMYDARGR